eukprot:gnl/TRDRNA2_/TRDRNA2_154775_c0_seq3.p1 gnl/TRDRNA2_/TRDRNA2_154775_c0~~gnl/TRDRNA2_/TRDRNA2_154775_c0_seq3.p1  ORF type:complete len:793 (-),score=240.27 gnl/TRDRNA2_/TRDRNA2_154775_c0_seq3:126-2234(-)
MALAECNIDDHGSIRHAKALEWAQDGLAIAREIDDKLLIANTSLVLSEINCKFQELEKSLENAREALTIFKRIKDKRGIALSLYWMAHAKGRTQEAKEAFSFAKELKSKRLQQKVLRVIAQIHLEKGNAEKAQTVAQESLALYLSLPGRLASEEVAIVRVLCESLVKQKQPKQAVRIAAEAASRFARDNSTLGEADVCEILMRAHEAAGNHEEVAKAAEDCLRHLVTLKLPHRELKVHQALAKCHIRRGEYQLALATLKEVKSLAQEMDNLEEEANACRTLGYVLLLTRELDQAQKVLNEAQELFQKNGDRKGEGSVIFLMSYAQGMDGELDSSLDTAQEAQALFQETDSKRQEANLLQLVVESHMLKGNYAEALRAAEEGIEVHKELSMDKVDTSLLAQQCRTAAGLHLREHNKENTKLAEERADEARRLSKLNKDISGEGQAQLLLTQVFMAYAGERSGQRMQEAYDKATSYSNEALILAKLNKDEELQGLALYWQAQVLFFGNQTDAGVEAAIKSANVFRKLEDKANEVSSLCLSADMYFHLKKEEDALKYAQDAMEIAMQVDDWNVQQTATETLERIEGKDKKGPEVAQVQETQLATAADVVEEQQVAVSSAAVKAAPKGPDPEMIMKKMTALVTDILATDEDLSLDASLMAAGVDSLSSLSLANSVAKEFGMAIGPTLIFEYPTVREIVDHIVEETS